MEGSKPSNTQLYGKSLTQEKGENSELKTNSLVKAKVLSISLQEVKESNEVVIGMLRISDQMSSSLFNSSILHSFISDNFSINCLLTLSILYMF